MSRGRWQIRNLSPCQMTAAVTPATATNKNVRWTLEGAEADTYISATGMVHFGTAQTGTLTIKATLVADPTKTDTCTWNPATGALTV